jgi:hypothetical protein
MLHVLFPVCGRKAEQFDAYVAVLMTRSGAACGMNGTDHAALSALRFTLL